MDKDSLKRILELEAELAELEAEKAAVESLNDELRFENKVLRGQLSILITDSIYPAEVA